MSGSVCIIGAGPGGLAAARALKAHGVPYEHVERNASVGGVWDIDAPGTPMYESAHFISSRTVSAFEGFPMPDTFPDYPSHRQVLAYLQDFADHFDLTETISFGRAVTGVTPAGRGWDVTLEDGQVRRFAGVVVATGVQWVPSMPDLPGFTGEVRHSVSYRDAAEFSGRRVLIVGGGNSGCDIACDAANSAAKASISLRRGYWFIPKHVFGLPSDIVGGKGSFLPKPLERAALQPLLRLLVGDLTRLGLQAPDHKLFETHPILNDQLLHHLRHGNVTPRPTIAAADGTKVTFADGTSDDFDLVLFATGYRHAVPFAQDLFGDPQHPDDLYLGAFSRTWRGLTSVGFIETNSSAFPLLDRQAGLVAGYLAALLAGSPRAEAFDRRVLGPQPDLSNGLRFSSTPRHRGYVDSDAMRRELDAVGREFGWVPE